MPQSSAQVGTGSRETLPGLFEGDGGHEEHPPDSDRRTRDALVTYEHTFYLGHEIVRDLANGIIAPELLALAKDAIAEPIPASKRVRVGGKVRTI